MSSTSAQDKSFSMSKNEVVNFLEKCGLDQYAKAFLEEGFDIMVAVREITEEDLEAMKVKRGHRRLIQRELATLIGIPKNQPIVINYNLFSSINSSTVFHSSNASSSNLYTDDPTPNSNTASVARARDGVPSQPFLLFNHLLLTCTRPKALNSAINRRFKRYCESDWNVSVKRPSANPTFPNTTCTEPNNQSHTPCNNTKPNLQEQKTRHQKEKEEKYKYAKSMVEYEKSRSYKNYHLYLTEFKRKQEEKANNTQDHKRTKLSISTNCKQQ